MCRCVVCRVVDVWGTRFGEGCGLFVFVCVSRTVGGVVAAYRILLTRPQLQLSPCLRHASSVPAGSLKITGGGRFGCFGQIGADS